jgi:hypothetical protein
MKMIVLTMNFCVGLIEERLLSIINPSSTTIADRGRDDNPPSGKNFSQTTRSHNPHVIEMPFVGDGTVMPPYEEPIVSPIAFTIGGSGFNVKDHLASNTDLTIWIGDTGANVSIYGDDDCGIESCGNPDNMTCDKPTTPAEQSWNPYCNCVRNCFHTGNTTTQDTSFNKTAWEKWDSWVSVKTSVRNYLIEKQEKEAEENKRLLTGIIDTMTSSDLIGAFGKAINNLIDAIGAEEAQDFLLKKLGSHLQGIFDTSPWQTDNPAGESSLERFTRYTKLESDCRDLCRDLAPGGGGSGGGSGGGFG